MAAVGAGGQGRELKPRNKWNGLRLIDPPWTDERWEVSGSDVVRAVALLGEPHRSVLVAQVEHALQGGEPLATRFAISVGAARVRLLRARVALLSLLGVGEGKKGQT